MAQQLGSPLRLLTQGLAYVPYGLASGASRVLTERQARSAARTIARGLFALRPPARRRLEQNLRRVLPAASPVEVRRHARQAFENFAGAFVDVLRLDRMSRDALAGALEVEGAEHVRSARVSERGVIVLSAHAGNWELGAAFLASAVPRVHLVARAHRNPWIERFFARRREAFGVHALRSRPLWPAAATALRRGEWLALMGDRAVPGRSASLCTFAAAMARRTGALLLPATMICLAGGRYRVAFHAPIAPSEWSGGGYRNWLRRLLVSSPGQWLAFEPLPDAWT